MSEPWPPPAPQPKKRRRWPWVVLGTGLALGAVAYSPTLFGAWILPQLAGTGISGGKLSGPLWSPTLSNADIKIKGLEAAVGRANVKLTGISAHKTAHLAVSLSGVKGNLKLKELLEGDQGGGGGGGSGWNVVLDRVDVQDSQLDVDGQGVNIPNASVRLGRVKSGPNAGKIVLHGHTDEGVLSAALDLQQAAQSRYTLDFDADARVLRHYWNGVEAGHLRGRYVFGAGPVQGDVKLFRGVLQVPEAKFIKIADVAGTIAHRGEKLSYQLAGHGWNGPVKASGGIDTRAQNWTVTADATPTLSGLAHSLGTTGEGQLKLRITAGGWSNVRVKAYAKGAGTFSGVPFTQGQAEYTFLKENGQHTPQTNDLQFSAQTALAGQQTLRGQWAFQRAGTLGWKGDFAGKPLDIQAKIAPNNDVRLSGLGLGGPLRGQFNLHDQELRAILNPDYGAARARVVLSGKPGNLVATVQNGSAGPFPVAGTARLNKQGFQANLGSVQLDLDPHWKGTWRAQDLRGAGLTLGGSGRIDLTAGDLSGDLQASLGAVEGTLQGPVSLNYLEKRGTFRPGAQVLQWLGDKVRLQASNLPLAVGARVSGDVTVDTGLNAYGRLTARGNGYNLRAFAQGQQARVRGDIGGVQVVADTNLRQPYRTRARLVGTDISGALSLQESGGVRFRLLTRGEVAQGVLDGANWNASGRVNLAALRPLLPAQAKDLSGVLRLNLAGLGGSAQVQASLAGTQIEGSLRRQPDGKTGDMVGRMLADLQATLPPPNASLSAEANGERPRVQLAGQVYPQVSAAGQVQYLGQRLAATVQGPYDSLTATLRGRTGQLTLGGVTVPAQNLNLRASLTPNLAVTGRWGELQAAYTAASGRVSLSGAQTLTARGVTGRVEGQASWGPGWAGTVQARGSAQGYQLALNGPWRRMNVLLQNAEGLRGVGLVSVPDTSYDLKVSGPLTLSGEQLTVQGNIHGTGNRPTGTLHLLGAAGGSADVTLNGLDQLAVRAKRLSIAGQLFEGQLTTTGGQVSGRLQAGPLSLVATNGQLRAWGTFADHAVQARGRLSLPSQLSDLQVTVSGPYLSAQASGDLTNLSGRVTLKSQSWGNAQARLLLPAQSFILRASPQQGRVTVGGLSYRAGQFGGGLNLRYALQTPQLRQGGRLRLAGSGTALTAYPQGPVSGQVQVYPALSGEVSTGLAPFMGLLPAELRAHIQPGRLVAQVRRTEANLSLAQTRYLNKPLGLQAALDWQKGLRVAGVLTPANSRIPVRYDGQNLAVTGASLDARLLEPLLPGARGRLGLSLNVPGLQVSRASGEARVDVQAQGQQARGTATLRGGQLWANLGSSLGGLNLKVRGPIYPQANASVSVADRRDAASHLQATLRGEAGGPLTVRVAGEWQGRTVSLMGTATGLTGTAPQFSATGQYANADLRLGLRKGAGAGLDAWKASGRVLIPDLVPLTGNTGALTGTLGGTLNRLTLQATGRVAGFDFTAPATYAGGQLSVREARVTLPPGQGQGRAVVSGTVFPTLNLSASATLHDAAPGEYRARLRGSPSKPNVEVSGTLRADLAGLQLAGTGVRARLLGQDWKAELSGARVSGQLRGQLGQQGPGGLQNADLTLNTAYTDPKGKTDVRLTGPLAWNARSGWDGRIHAAGTLSGQALDALVTGEGQLKASAQLGTGDTVAGVVAALPASLPLKPAGQVTLKELDAGAFWGKPGQLRATGTATLAGNSWAALQAQFAGQLHDSAGELSGDVKAQYAAGNWQASLSGPRVSGAASLVGGAYQLSLNSQEMHLSRLLPDSVGIQDLTFGGRVQVVGTAAGPSLVQLEQVALRGTQQQGGPFSLYGSAEYQPRGEVFKADLRGSLRGGLVSAQGSLPSGLRVNLQDVATNYATAASVGNGKVSGELLLTGRASDPFVSGRLNAVTDELVAALTLSGRARDPRAHLQADLKGETRGTVYAELSQPDFARGTLQTSLYGTVSQGENRARLRLAGTWPRLSGEVQAQVSGRPLTLRGQGDGTYTLTGGAAGSGNLSFLPNPQNVWLPKLSGSLNLSPLALVEGSRGEAGVQASISGTLDQPQLSGTLYTRDAEVSGVLLDNLSGTVTGNRSGLSATLTQGSEVVGEWHGQTLTLSNLSARAAGSRVRVSGNAKLGGQADLTLVSTGNVAGNLKATYQAQALKVQGDLNTQGFQTAVNVQASPEAGWSGTLTTQGGPAGLLTGRAALTVKGDLAHPLLSGTAGVLGAEARIVASATGVQLRLTDGPDATATGAVEMRPNAAGEWRWSGATSLTRPELSLSVTPTGPLADPSATVTLRRGEWQGSGTVSKSRAELNITDSLRSGNLSWNGEQVSVNLPGLDLALLGLPGVNGRLTAQGQLSPQGGGSGNFTFTLRDFAAPQRLPIIDLDFRGDLSGTLAVNSGVPTLRANADLNPGTAQAGALAANVTQIKVGEQRRWAGSLSGLLKKDSGSAALNVSAGASGLRGALVLSDLPVTVAGKTTAVQGRVTLQGQTFNAALRAAGGKATATAEGGLADALPVLGNLFAVQPTGDGYNARAIANNLDISRVVPQLGGIVSGEANLNDGGGTFFLNSAGLKVGPRILPARLDGTRIGADWRLRGLLGSSTFTAGLNEAGEVFGQGNLRGLPLGAVVAALTGQVPGQGLVTGTARFRFPVSDPLAGSATVVAERIRVSTLPESEAAAQGEGETLMGSGTLDYANRELRNINVQMSGAGTWDVQGQYTRQKVDLDAKFTGTTFTPVLRLIPGLTDLQPALKGSLTLSAAGTYEQPRGLLRAENLTGSLAGLSVQVPQFAGELPDSGAFTGSGTILTGGSVRSNGKLSLSGQLSSGKLSGTQVQFSGLLAPEALGALPNTTATLRQDGDSWQLEAQSLSAPTTPASAAGVLKVSGTVSPRLDLGLSAQNYNLPLALIYGRESSLNAALQATDDGRNVRVSGNADFARLILGRVDAPATIPAPGETGSNKPALVDYASPLPPQYTTFAQPTQEGAAASPTSTLPFLERLRFDDVKISAPGGIRVDENLARAEFGTAGLTVSGSGANPRISGEILAQRGSIFLRENEFSITSGTVRFVGESVYPTFNIVAQGSVPSSTTNQRVPMTLQLEGDFRTVNGQPNVLRLQTTLRCPETAGNACVNPATGNPYGEAELYALLATGVPDLASLPNNLNALGNSALQTALNVFVLGELERTLARALGVDVIRLTPSLSTNGDVNATFTVGSYVTRNLFLQYQVDLRGDGLVGATYTTPDNRFTFRVTTPLVKLDLQSVQPSFSAAYNISNKASISFGVQTLPETTKLNFGLTYRIGAK